MWGLTGIYAFTHFYKLSKAYIQRWAKHIDDVIIHMKQGRVNPDFLRAIGPKKFGIIRLYISDNFFQCNKVIQSSHKNIIIW